MIMVMVMSGNKNDRWKVLIPRSPDIVRCITTLPICLILNFAGPHLYQHIILLISNDYENKLISEIYHHQTRTDVDELDTDFRTP